VPSSSRTEGKSISSTTGNQVGNQWYQPVQTRWDSTPGQTATACRRSRISAAGGTARPVARCATQVHGATSGSGARTLSCGLRICLWNDSAAIYTDVFVRGRTCLTATAIVAATATVVVLVVTCYCRAASNCRSRCFACYSATYMPTEQSDQKNAGIGSTVESVLLFSDRLTDRLTDKLEATSTKTIMTLIVTTMDMACFTK
jgi:hypothetical protein